MGETYTNVFNKLYGRILLMSYKLLLTQKTVYTRILQNCNMQTLRDSGCAHGEIMDI